MAGRLTLRYRERDATVPGGDAPLVHVQVSLLSGETYAFAETLKPRKGYFSKGIRIRGEQDGEIANVFARYRSHRAEASIRWRTREAPVIEELQWQRRSYTLQTSKVRRALLYAPWEIVANDDELTIQVSPAGVIQITADEHIFQYDYELNAGVCVVDLISDQQDGTGTIEATLGDQRATADLRFSQARSGGLEIDLDIHDIPRRAWFEESTGVLRVNAGHQALSRILGSRDEGWPGQHSSAFQAMLAEVLATTIVRHSLSRTEEYSRDSDINVLFSTFDTKVATVAGRLQRALIGAEDLKAIAGSSR